ncbi:MAG: ABC transporter permease [Pseudomonadota bacterium]
MDKAILADSVSGKDNRKKEEILSPSKLAWQTFKKQKLGIIGSLMVLFLIFIALFGDFISPYDPLQMHTKNSLQGPSAKYWLGTDRFGRDQLSRLINGTRISIIVSFGSMFLAAAAGVIIGLVSGYYGGRIDSIIMRLLDVVFAFPMLLLALIMVAILGPNLRNVLFAIAFTQHARFARIVRGSVLSVKEKEYVEGIRSVGAKNRIIITRFILPNVFSPIIVQATWGLSIAIMYEAALSFLGMGTQPPMPSWGLMLNESRRFMEIAPWLTIFPGLSIVFAVLGFNLMGDALRDALDPRLAQR